MSLPPSQPVEIRRPKPPRVVPPRPPTPPRIIPSKAPKSTGLGSGLKGVRQASLAILAAKLLENRGSTINGELQLTDRPFPQSLTEELDKGKRRRPCPVDGNRACDGKRCGGRSAWSQGRTTRYERRRRRQS